MSTNKVDELEVEAADEVCASCGIAGVDDITLKFCDDCDLIKYCSDECQENHREQHDAACKKRKAELHDKKIFEQPDGSHMGECPICCLPLHLDPRKSIMMTCCSKVICNGCDYVNKMREIAEGLEHRCAFCREPVPKSDEEQQVMERIKKNDPAAMTQMGKKHYSEGDYGKAVEYWTKAAEMGDAAANYCLGDSYYRGNGVEKDVKKAVYHREQAAIGGHPAARLFLGLHESENGRFDRAAKHWIIAANLGCDTSLKLIKELFIQGIVGEEDYTTALRGYQSAVDETKSPEREEVEAFHASLD